MTTPPPVDDRIALPSGVELAVTRFEPSTTEDHAASATPIVLTHGLASNRRLWHGAAPVLAAAGHRVVTVDQRGHGVSDRPDDGYDMATVADDLAHLLDALDLAAPVVAGQSWGGNVVLELAHRHPDRTSGIVMVDGGFLHLAARFPDWDACRAALAPPPLVGRPVAEIRGWIEQMAADWPADGREATLANFEVRADGTIAPHLTFERHLLVLRGLWEHDPTRRYPTIDQPALVVAADDGSRPTDAQEEKVRSVDEAVDALPHGAAVWFRPAHHDVHAQHPDAVAGAILDWMEGVGISRRSPSN